MHSLVCGLVLVDPFSPPGTPCNPMLIEEKLKHLAIFQSPVCRYCCCLQAKHGMFFAHGHRAPSLTPTKKFLSAMPLPTTLLFFQPKQQDMSRHLVSFQSASAAFGKPQPPPRAVLAHSEHQTSSLKPTKKFLPARPTFPA